MTKRRRLRFSLLVIILLFGLNLVIYFWGNQKRNASFEELRRAVSRQILVASIDQKLGDLQQHVGLLSQVRDETGSGLGPAEISDFSAQVDAVGEQIRELYRLSDEEAGVRIESLEKTHRELGISWKNFYENFGRNHVTALTELVVRADPISQRVIGQLLPQLQEDENQRAKVATSNFYEVARLTDRMTVLIFLISSAVAVSLAYGVVKLIRQEALILEVAHDLSGELQIDVLLGKIIRATTELLDADRSTLFVYDRKTDELWSRVAEGDEIQEIRIPSNTGLAGIVFQSGKSENVSDPYNHPAFNPEIDRQTGYKTESILCMPIITKDGVTVGVAQVLNKRGGQFTTRDESRLRAFAGQIAVSLHNAQLFDEVLNVKNYNESILKSTSNGMITLDTDRNIVTANDQVLSLLGVKRDELIGKPANSFFKNANSWVMDRIAKVETTDSSDTAVDATLLLPDGKEASINLATVPLVDVNEEHIGTMLIIEDITTEKRVKTTMARYMSREVVDQLLESGEAMLGGKNQKVSILFSDIRNFTNTSEALGARETVSMLNEYFTDMVDVIFQHGGILDKYIGDAIMALFGVPFNKPEDADKAIRVANEMILTLGQLNKRRQAEQRSPIDIRIGISTGEVIAGNIGSPKRLEYTVIGDSVNLASRLEGANKFYGTRILVSESTVRDLHEPVIMREIDLIRVKGKDEPVGVFEPLDYHSPDSFPHMDDVLGADIRGLQCYRNQDWKAAVAMFEKALEANGQDVPSQIYLDRCRQYLESPPSKDWDSVWVMTEK